MLRPGTRGSRFDPQAMKVWITRASPGAEATASRLAALGFTPLVLPLLEVRALPAKVDLKGIDALVFTSINAVAAFAALSPDRGPRVFTVGDATARAAAEAGFTSICSADGNLTALAALIRTEARGLALLNPTAAKPAGDLAALVDTAARVLSVPVYETSETGNRPPDTWDTVLIHRPRAAHALAALGPTTEPRFACAISAAAAAPLSGLSFSEVRIAATPSEDALLGTLGKPGPAV